MARMFSQVNEMLLHTMFAFQLNMVFNVGMDKSNQKLAVDRKRIADLGGPARVAELLGYDRTRGGVQRVSNWIDRGIPSRVKLERPDLFLADRLPSVAGGGAVSKEGA
jgi:hypothetical protein